MDEYWTRDQRLAHSVDPRQAASAPLGLVRACRFGGPALRSQPLRWGPPEKSRLTSVVLFCFTCSRSEVSALSAKSPICSWSFPLVSCFHTWNTVSFLLLLPQEWSLSPIPGQWRLSPAKSITFHLKCSQRAHFTKTLQCWVLLPYCHFDGFLTACV